MLPHAPVYGTISCLNHPRLCVVVSSSLRAPLSICATAFSGTFSCPCHPSSAACGNLSSKKHPPVPVTLSVSVILGATRACVPVCVPARVSARVHWCSARVNIRTITIHTIMTCIWLAINLKQYYTLTTLRWLALRVPLNKMQVLLIVNYLVIILIMN